ncbi:MAG: Hsp20 family protein [Alphaproteobacteria bacterium]
MRTYDLSPLFRTTVGFDRMDRLFDSMLSNADQSPSYPPYNIETLSDSAYRISMAVAGFSEDQIEVTQQQNSLLVKGRAGGEDKDRNYLHRGIAGRGFERRFVLADHVNVRDAGLKNGMLYIELVREVPEALKPRTISVNGATGLEKLARKKAA